MMRGPGQGQGQLHDTFVSAINTAMVAGVLVSLLVATAALLGRRLLRPVEDVRTATRHTEDEIERKHLSHSATHRFAPDPITPRRGRSTLPS